MKFFKTTIISLILLLSFPVFGVTEHKILSSSNTVFLNDYFYDTALGKVEHEIREKAAKLKPGERINLVISSGGGIITHGLRFIDSLKGISVRNPVDTVVLFAASMGFETVQHLSGRYILEHGTLMSHRAYGGFFGYFPNGEIDSEYEFWKRKVFAMNKVAVDRTKGKFTMESYLKAIQGEYWCDGEYCVNDGFADKVVTAVCDESLQGSYIDKSSYLVDFREKKGFGESGFQTIHIDFDIEYDKCPVYGLDKGYGVYAVFNKGTPEERKIFLQGSSQKVNNAEINSLGNPKIQEIINFHKGRKGLIRKVFDKKDADFIGAL